MKQAPGYMFGWIEACLRYGGTFGIPEKKSYSYMFDVQKSTVSRHQSAFMDCMRDVFGPDEGGIEVDRRKLLVPEGARFLDSKPIFPLPDLALWMRQVLMSGNQDRETNATFLKIDRVERRDPDPRILRLLVDALRDKKPLRILYQGRNDPIGKRRLISPHAIVDIADRYHVRAFNHDRNRFTDFVLNRISWGEIENDKRLYHGEENDEDWHRKEKVIVSVREGFIAEAIAAEFDLGPDGTKAIEVRKALIPYLVDDHSRDYSKPVSVLNGEQSVNERSS